MIIHLTSDMTFQKTFLLTYVSFTTPEKLVRKLIQRYNGDPKTRDSKEPHQRAITKQIQLRVVNVLRKWLSYLDVNPNEQLTKTLTTFLDHLKQDSENLSAQLGITLQRKVSLL